MAAGSQAKLSPTPPRAEPPALRIKRGHVDTAGLERLLLQLAQTRAGSDDRLGTALDELRSRMNGPSAGANPVPHIESLEERVADLALRVQGGSDVPASGVPNGTGLDSQFRELNAALEASLNSQFNPDPPRVDAHPATTGLQELQAIADRLQVIEDAVNSAGSQSARIESIEARLSELMQGVSAFGPQIDQVAQRAAAEMASQIGESQQAADAVARLDTIQRELQSLTQRASRMDERTLSTLETISGTLLRLAERTRMAEAATMDEPRRQEKPPEPGDSRRATIKPDKPPPASDAAPIEEMEEETEGLKTASDDAPAMVDVQAEETETVAIETRAPLPRRLASDARKPGKILVIAAVALLILSAGLLYGRLNSQTGGAPGHLAPTAPAPADPATGPEGSHAQQPETGNGNATAGGADGQSLEGEETQQPPQKLETIPATRFDRASLVITDPQALGPGLILK